MTDRRLSSAVGYLLLLLTVVLVVGAWVASALDMEVQNVLSAEGLRWLFVHSLDDAAHLLPACLLLLLAVGGVGESGLWADLLRPSSSQRRRAGLVSGLLLLLLVALFLMAVCLPASPLLSLKGQLWPSPFLRGLVPVLGFCLVGLCALHAWLSGRMARAIDLFPFLSRALGRHLAWLIVALQGLFLYNLYHFIR